MKNYDYNKILKIFASVIDKNHKMDFESQSDRTDSFTVIFTNETQRPLRCDILLGKYDMKIIVPGQEMSAPDFQKILPRFEYEMEQIYLRNIKLETMHREDGYHIIIEF